MFIRREAEDRILAMSREHPVITVAGPRHSGKTTLVRRIFPHHRYMNLDDPATLEFARTDPAGFLGRCSEKNFILDELRRAPELLSYMRINAGRLISRPGQFVLTTSHLQPSDLCAAIPPKRLMAMQILPPLTMRELSGARIDLERDEYLFRGFMPRVYREGANPQDIYRDYLTRFVNYDVRRLVNIDGRIRKFKLLMIFLAARIGQIINMENLARKVGVNMQTLKKWIEALEASFIIFKLPCCAQSLGKRVTKTPKYYFTDVGMATYLLKIKSAKHVFKDPLVGNLFENMVVAEALKHRYNQGKNPELYYFRNHNLIEIDLIVDKKHHLLPFEIKCVDTFNSRFAQNMNNFRQLAGNIVDGYVIYSGKTRPGKTAEKGVMPRFVNFKEIRELALG